MARTLYIPVAYRKPILGGFLLFAIILFGVYWFFFRKRILKAQEVVDKAKTSNQFAGDKIAAVEILTREFEKHGDGDKRKLAYILASAEHESRLGALMFELGDRSYFDKYEGRKDLGNTQAGDGYRFRGRGYIQITGRANYAKFSKILGIDLVSDPDRAVEPAIAAQIAVIGMTKGSFTGKSLRQYFNVTADWVNARKIVNNDVAKNGESIAAIAKSYYETIS